MNYILLFLIAGAIPSYCQESETSADDKCAHGKCEVYGDVDDDGLNLLQRSSSITVKSGKHIARGASTVAERGTDSRGKYDPENDVYSDVDISQSAKAGSSSGSSGSSGSSSPSGSSSSSSPSSPPPTPPPSPTPAPPSPTPTTAAPSSPSPSPQSTQAPSPTPATTAAPSPTNTETQTATVTHTQTHTETHTSTHTHTSTTTTTTYLNHTAAAAAAERERSSPGIHGPGAFTMWIIGIIIFIASFKVNWKTESAATQMETLYDRADAECKTVKADKAEPENRNTLVHVVGEASSVMPVEDKYLDVKLPNKCGLRTTVSVYQEEPNDDGDDGKGKGKGKGKDQPKFSWTIFAPDESAVVPPGVHTNFSSRIDLGQGFHLDMETFNSGLNLNENVTWKGCNVGPQVAVKNRAGKIFKKAADNKYYDGEKDHPKPGDKMVEFEEMDVSGKISVMALQVKGDDPERDTFLPYVLIPHTCPCYDADSEQEKEDLLEGGKAALDADKNLEDEIKPDCWSILSCSFCFGVMFRPEIRFIDMTKTFNKDQILEQMRSQTSNMKIFCRVLGFLMLFFGIKWTFDPIADVLTFIPLIGGLLSALVGFVIWVFALIMSILIYLIIKIIAAGYYNPVRALIYGAILAVIIICIIVFGGSSSHAH